jgi:two-component system LytT family response regulator
MNCIVIDDEPLAREGLESYIRKVGFLKLMDSFENPLLATERLGEGKTDLIFLDIHMPHLTGIEFLRQQKNPPLVIFHTAYPNFALEGYQLDVMDYLVKPVTFDRFYKAVTKAYEYHQLQQKAQNSQQEIRQADDFFFVKCDGRYEKVVVEEILYIEAMQNYSLIQTIRQKYMTLMPLKSFEEMLSAEKFSRVQKSYIVALDKIESLAGNEIKVGGKVIPLGKQQREELFNRLIDKRLKA